MTLQDDYKSIREGAVIGAIAPRRQIAVAGPDRASYLQGLLTNDIPALAPGTGCYAAWLTPQGRMLTDMHVLESDGMILLDVPADSAAATLERLDRFLFSEDVRIEALTDSLTGVWIHGPRAAAALEASLGGVAGLTEWADYRHATLEFAGAPVSLARIDQIGVPGYCVYLEPSREAALVAALESAGAVRVGAEALNAARIEAGYPIFGIDMTEDTIPLEAGIEQRAVSFTKGCYVGQEIIIRVLHRGGGRVAKKLVTLAIDGPPGGGTPARGAKVYSGDREIGYLTSAASSPRLGAIALAYLHRDFVAPGTGVELLDNATRVSAVVGERPMTAAGAGTSGNQR